MYNERKTFEQLFKRLHKLGNIYKIEQLLVIVAESMTVFSQAQRPAAMMHRSPSGHRQTALYATRPAQNPFCTLTQIVLGCGGGHKAFLEGVTLL